MEMTLWHDRLTSKHFPNGVSPNWRSDVEMSGNGSTTDVKPVLIVGSEFLGFGRLDNVNPFRNFGLPRSAF